MSIITRSQKLKISISFLFLPVLILSVCIPASAQKDSVQTKEKVHSVYITSNTALRTNASNDLILNEIVQSSKKEDSSTLIFVGNIVPEKGYPDKDNGRNEVEKELKKNLLEKISDFKGNIVFTPGYHEWQADAPDNIDDLESFLQDNSRGKFWPNDGCPIESESLGNGVQLIMVDSQWYLENWDDHPYINNKCEIKTRAQFREEFNDELEDNQKKTVLVAVFHPVMTKTKLSFWEMMVGAGDQTRRNPQLGQLMGILETIARQYNDVIFLSGQDKNLQYIKDDGIEQVIAGVTEKPAKAKPEEDKDGFASYELGYVKMNINRNGSSNVEFYEVNPSGTKKIFSHHISRERPTLEEVSWPETRIGPTATASVYTEEQTDKSGFHKSLWGEHYRPLYSKKFEFPVLYLDTLPGNLQVLGAGGGHQSRSLGFRDEDGHEYTMRALEKSALQFLQTTVITTHYIKDYLENTIAERYVKDFYTTAFPYGTFPAGRFMDELGIFHPNSELYYVPKQEALGVYNEDYGNELYMFEAHVGGENKDLEIFGNADDILNTADLMLEMQETKDVYVDEEMFIRARLLDMLLGDWDRHEGQYEWAEFEEENGKKRYLPIAKDRDQVFPKTDGFALSMLRLASPPLRAMEEYSDEVKRPKWFNVAGYPLDKAFIRNADWEDWKAQVDYIQNNITDEVIKEAFDVLPQGIVEEGYVGDIKKTMKARRANLEKIAREYYKHLTEFDVFTGTQKDDQFLITRMADGITLVELKNKDGELLAEKKYNSDQTREVWIYGLDGDDEFKIIGDGSNLVPLKIIGGEENDIYDFQNTRKAKLYDFKSKKSTIKTPGVNKMLVDSYDINNYDPKKKKIRQFTLFPSADFNSDVGFKLGVRNTYTTYGLVRNPFTTRQSVTLNYFFRTQGFEADYTGEFAHIFYNWNFGLNAYYSSPNFTMNYFGTGNETDYDPDEIDKEYNRVRMQQWRFAPSLIWRNDTQSSFSIKPMIESIEVKNDEGFFVSDIFAATNPVFDSQLYAGGEINYNYFNKDRVAFPSRGIELDLTAGYKSNIDENDNKFGYVRPMLSLNYPLHESGFAALATKIGGEAIIGDDFEFYHAATLGGGNTNSLRGYRNDRFNGKYAFYQNIDLRSGITEFRSDFVPVRIGASAGFDYGRVWVDNDNSSEWHTNYGGSIFINAFKAATGNIGYYVGDEGGRLNFTFNFAF
ncbi:metallophosphatase [Christiangramia sabulilitoris]|uniref:Metallophosphatase n=1 Tax=Christiangramia sabulilitoris TaxID=2583991 RepID=A0A550I9M3_9FLAO|nr:metallophosphatase [Christiangramia sabulilitoris]TRO67518.1 metallophosphatase [Christiangramia sabulilitoris]